MYSVYSLQYHLVCRQSVQLQQSKYISQRASLVSRVSRTCGRTMDIHSNLIHFPNHEFKHTSLPPAFQLEPVSTEQYNSNIASAVQFPPLQIMESSTVQSTPPYEVQHTLPAQPYDVEPTSYNTALDSSSQFPQIDGEEFNCIYCLKKYKKKSSLRYHVNQHKAPHREFCSICQQFTLREKYLDHVKFKCSKLAHKERKIKCETCQKKFRTHRGLIQHKKIHEIHETRQHNLHAIQGINNSMFQMMNVLFQSLHNHYY